MATNQKEEGLDDLDQNGRENNQEKSSSQETQGSSNEHRGNSQETQDNSDDDSNRGFAAMDNDKQREMASKDDKAVHESGHGFGSKGARKAGRKRSLL